MKILYHHRIRSKDGQYVHLEEMVRALRGLGHEVIVCGPAAVESEPFGAEAGFIDVLKRNLPNAVYEFMELGYAILDYMRLARAIKQHKPDCIYERYQLYVPSGVWAKHRFKLPMLLEINAPLFEQRCEFGGIALKGLARWTEEYAWRGADMTLPVTAALADIVEEAGVPRERMHVIPNGVNLERFGTVPPLEEAKRALGLGGRTVLGFTGFMREWHCLEEVLDVLLKAPADDPWHLLAVGDGPARQGLEAKAKRLGISDRLTVTGIVERDEVARYVASFDIALQTAIVPYASPLKLFEYLVMGRPIVSPAVPSSTEILTDGENALLYDAKDINSLKATIERLLSNPPLRAKLGAAARATIFDRKLLWDDHARTVQSLFEPLIAHRTGH